MKFRIKNLFLGIRYMSFLDKNTAFITIPKNASSNQKRILISYNYNLIKMSQEMVHSNKYLFNYKKLSFLINLIYLKKIYIIIRDPISRFLSAYNQRGYDKTYPNISLFIKNLEDSNFFDDHHLYPQKYFVPNLFKKKLLFVKLDNFKIVLKDLDLIDKRFYNLFTEKNPHSIELIPYKKTLSKQDHKLLNDIYKDDLAIYTDAF